METNIKNSKGDDIKSDVPLSKRRLILLQTGKLSDCSFIVGEELDESEKDLNVNTRSKQFHCHKMILATASDVFARMFYGSFCDQPNPIKVSDITPQIFEMLLTYIYSDEIDAQCVHEENFSELMYIGEKYLMHHFITRCVDVLRKNDCSLANTLPIFELGCLYDNLSVILMSYENIRKHSTRIEILLNHPTFYDLNVNNMARLMIFLKQLPIMSNRYITLICALEAYGRRNNLSAPIHSQKFVKLVSVSMLFMDQNISSTSFEYFLRYD